MPTSLTERRAKIEPLLSELVAWVTDARGDVDPGTFREQCDKILIEALGGSTTGAFAYLRNTGIPALDTALALVGLQVPPTMYAWDVLLPGHRAFMASSEGDGFKLVPANVAHVTF